MVRRFKVWNPRVSHQKKFNFSQLKNKPVAAFETNGRWTLSLLSLPHIFLFTLDAKKYFYYISSVFPRVPMFVCPFKQRDMSVMTRVPNFIL